MRGFPLFVGYAATSPRGRGFPFSPIITQLGREDNISTDFYVCIKDRRGRRPYNAIREHPYENQPKESVFYFLFLEFCGRAMLAPTMPIANPHNIQKEDTQKIFERFLRKLFIKSFLKAGLGSRPTIKHGYLQDRWSCLLYGSFLRHIRKDVLQRNHQWT